LDIASLDLEQLHQLAAELPGIDTARALRRDRDFLVDELAAYLRIWPRETPDWLKEA
jgi:hypothetical protein